MNIVDFGILVVIGIFAIGGLKRGFLLGIVDVLTFALSLVVGAKLSAALAQPIHEFGFPLPLASGMGFFVAGVISFAILGLAAKILLFPLGSFGAGTPLAWVNSILGLLPGAFRGLALAALGLLLIAAVPRELGARQYLAGSQLALPIAEAGRQALDDGLRWAGIDPSSLGLPSEVIAGGGTDLPFSGVTDLRVDVEAEQELLELVNEERARAGLDPLQPNDALAEVGRQHGREMFSYGYFSHESPISGTPADRLNSAGLDYPLQGENIALASTAVLAHEGLMNSPAHRANILNPGFTRVGISVLRSVDHGLMVTQEFGG
jgi:uncharacterized membrane protein required for colicin V production